MLLGGFVAGVIGLFARGSLSRGQVTTAGYIGGLGAAGLVLMDFALLLR